MTFSFLPLARRIGKLAMAAIRKEGGRREIAENPLGQRTIAADKWIEDIVAAELRRSGIPCVLVSEEAGVVEISKNPEWAFVCDPLDGSTNYKKGIPLYCLGLCYAPVGGRMRDVREAFVLELVRGEEFYCAKGKGAFRNGKKMQASKVARMRDAILSLDFNQEGGTIGRQRKIGLLGCKDHRRFGPDLLDMCYCACGAVDGFVHVKKSLSAIHASGAAMLEETCVVTDTRGKPLDAALRVDACVDVVAAGTMGLHKELLAAVGR